MKKLLLILVALMPMLLSAQVKKLGKKSTADDVQAYATAKVQAGAVDEAIAVLNEYGPKMKTDLDKAKLKTSLSMIYRDKGDFEAEQKVLLEGVALLQSAIDKKSYDVKKISADDIRLSMASYNTELCSIAIAYDSLDQAEKLVNEAINVYKGTLETNPANHYYMSLCQGYLARIAVNKGMKALAAIYNNDSYKSLGEYTKAYPVQGENIPIVSGMLYSITMIHREVENYSSAIELINKGIRLGYAPHLPGFYDELGVIYVKMNNFAAAQKTYAKVIELDPTFYDTHLMSDLRFLFHRTSNNNQ